MAIANVTLSDTFVGWINKTNLAIGKANQVDGKASNTYVNATFAANSTVVRITGTQTVGGSKTFTGANTNILGGTLLFTSNTNLFGFTNFTKTLTLTARAKLWGANTDIQGGSLLVTSNTKFVAANTTLTSSAGTFLVRNKVKLHGANTDIRSGTFFVRANTVINGAMNFVNDGAFDIGGVSRPRDIYCRGIQGYGSTDLSVLTVSGANTTISSRTSALLNQGATRLYGANTNIRGGSLLVTSNTTILANTHVVGGTHVARKGAPIRHIGLGANTYTLAIGDNGNYLRAANTGGMTLTVPTNASVAFPVGTEIVVVRTGANNWLTFANSAGVIMNTNAGKRKLAGQYNSAMLKKVATNTWDLIGGVS